MRVAEVRVHRDVRVQQHSMALRRPEAAQHDGRDRRELPARAAGNGEAVAAWQSGLEGLASSFLAETLCGRASSALLRLPRRKHTAASLLCCGISLSQAPPRQMCVPDVCGEPLVAFAECSHQAARVRIPGSELDIHAVAAAALLH